MEYFANFLECWSNENNNLIFNGSLDTCDVLQVNFVWYGSLSIYIFYIPNRLYCWQWGFSSIHFILYYPRKKFLIIWAQPCGIAWPVPLLDQMGAVYFLRSLFKNHRFLKLTGKLTVIREGSFCFFHSSQSRHFALIYHWGILCSIIFLSHD